MLDPLLVHVDKIKYSPFLYSMQNIALTEPSGV